jgi:AcrR family transcriptional regulator
VATNQNDSPARGTAGGAARRAHLERAAAEVLADVGYAAASVGRIAEHAGVSKGVVTYHFASKDEILRRVALRLFEDAASYIAAQVANAATPLERLRTSLRAELEFFSSRRVEFRAMSEVMGNHRDADFAHAFEEVSAGEALALSRLLEEGQRDGQFRAFDAVEFAHLITALKNGLLERWADEPTLDLTAAAVVLLDFVEAAVLAR